MRIAIKWGVILAASIALWTLVVHLLGIYTYRIQYADTVDQVVLVLPIIVLTLALLEERRLHGGELPIWRGAVTGLMVGAVSAPLTVGALWLYHHYINPEWLSIVIANTKVQLAAAGATPDAIAARVAQLEQGGTDANQIRSGLLGSVLMGLVLSIILSLILRAQQYFERRSP